jgi:polysaccharide pyruvyl transferase WcaK-like protein
MKKLLFTLLLFLFTFSAYAEALTTVHMRGEAYNKSNKLVYIESHVYKKKDSGEITEIQTKYNAPDGKLIAEIESTFSKDPYIPDTIFIDHRFNEKQELTYDTVTKTVNMKLTDKSGKVKTNSIARTENMVSGQGFHNYILKHYDDKKSDIKFIVLPKLDYYSFYFEKKLTPVEGQREFVLKISNWVLRAVVKEIVVTYRDNDRALLNFEGLTNLDSDSHDSQVLNIKISYP